MVSITFRQLVDLLPRGDEFRAKRLPPGLAYVETANPRFVEPSLEVLDAIEPGRTSLVLVAAPGAVGKSTLAAEIAMRSGATLWDLAHINVGSGTFSGMVLDAYDFEATGVLKRIQDGRFLFVVDALDEAEVRAGSQNFHAFLGDIAASFRDPRPKPTLVVLARNDTADWIHLVLEESGVPLARYQVAYFDEAQAASFIAKRLDDLHARASTVPVHRQQSEPFARVREELFAIVYDLFEVPRASAWQDRRVRDFLGYAPVLEALADFLNVGNYAALLQELKERAAAAQSPWQFLADIVRRLQVREHEKVLAAIRVRLDAVAARIGWNGWGALYDSGEQCARVLRHSLRLPVGAKPKGLPPALGDLYEDSLKTILPQHPFLSGRKFANVVFREFAYAWGISRADPESAAALRTAMRAREEPFLPSPLFGEFVASEAGGGNAVVDAQDFGVVYESFLSRNRKVELSLVATDESIEASIVLEEGREEGRELEILDAGTGIHFWRRLQQADVDIPGGVHLGLQGQRFILGPAVDIRCGEFVVACDDLDVDARGNVSVAAESHSLLAPNLRLRVVGTEHGRLAVMWPGLGHPWVQHKGERRGGGTRLDETLRGDALRKFILMFRRQRSRKEETVRGARWSPEQCADRDELLDLALEFGVLTRNPKRYTSLVFSSAYDTLMTLITERPQLSSGAKKFVAAYLGADATERLFGAR